MKVFSKYKILCLVVVCFIVAQKSGAQILPKESQDDGLEELYDKFEGDEKVQEAQTKKQLEQTVPSQVVIEDKDARDRKNFVPQKLSDLAVLAPFEDVVVIQKRFLPKTMRAEISGSGIISANNAFFNNLGLSGRLAFFFTEKYGIEMTYAAVSSSDRPITEGLIDRQNIETDALVEPESYYSINFKWAPIYGKMAWFQQTIIPFDFYIAPGIGMTQTSYGDDATTFSLGVGQLFALDKSLGLRWDLVYNAYNADVLVDNVVETVSHNDLFLSFGVSFFFPEAGYR
jgi:outer membrane beta-barrel protein